MNPKPLVLIVDDSPTQVRHITNTLAIYGVRICTCDNGLEALRLVDEERPDIIILDINLPGLDGYQVCHRLKRDSRTAAIPVIMLTTADNAIATIHGLEVGADDYIPKDSMAMDNLTATLSIYLKFPVSHGRTVNTQHPSKS